MSQINFTRNEIASTVYSTDVLTKMLIEEGGSLFDARSASLGHTLQGGVPSPVDRARAVRLSLRCMTFLEEGHEAICQQKPRPAALETAAVIIIQGSVVKWVPVNEMVQHADMANRRGKTNWWAGIKDLVEQLAGKPQFLGIPKTELHARK